MGVDVLDFEIVQYVDGFQCLLVGVFWGNICFVLVLVGDVFKQGVVVVLFWFICGEGGVKMDMWFDEGWDCQLVLGVDSFGVGSLYCGLGGDVVNYFVLQVKGKQCFLVVQVSVNNFYGGFCKWFCDKCQIISVIEVLR